MLNKSTNYINLLVLILMSYLAFVGLKPNNVAIDDVIEGNFHIQNAFDHVQALAQSPHFVGAEAHSQVKNYVFEQLQQLGLQVELQSTNAVSSRNAFSHVENIIAKIPGSDGNAKALMLMSHYDSASPASLGAADAGAGVAILLEGVRAYLELDIKPKNDIIILITDGEEMGLIGASAFVNKHPWANKIGAVLNFEARGSAGPSYMLMETNHGNSKLLDAYIDADLPYTASDSLGYSIYKSLPNDTDLTVFRVDKDILGFNFAFIDDHFNYHTELDSAQNLSLDSLAFQAHYLMPLLRSFSQIDLTTLQSDEDDVFFQIPYWTTIKYPFAWSLILSLLNLLVFVVVLGIGLRKKSVNIKSMICGLVPLGLSLFSTGLCSFLILTFLYWLHPQYSEILQGFTYNGHGYIVFFSLLAINFCYFCYRSSLQKHSASNLIVIPTLLWILISIAAALLLTGAHFFILFGVTGTLILLHSVMSDKPKPIVTVLLFAIIILIFFSFTLLPVALGMQLLPYSGLLLVLMLSVFISCLLVPEKTPINAWLLLVPLFCSFAYAQMGASTDQERPLPNSLYYFQDQDSNSAFWMNNDNNTDVWNEAFFAQDRLTPEELSVFRQQNWPWIKIVSKTENRQISAANIELVVDEHLADRRHLQLQISLQRPVNVLNIINNKTLNLLKLSVNNEIMYDGESKVVAANQYLCGMIRTTEQIFTLDIEVEAGELLDINLLEFSFNLLSSADFDIPARPKEFIAKPFINSDSIVTKQRVAL